MPRLLLDSTVLIDALRGRAAADRLRAMRGAGDVPFVCAVSVEEIWRGLRPAEQDAAAGLIGGLRLASLGKAEGQLAGQWRRELAGRGITVHQADCLIAAAAVGVGAAVATGNPKDFQRLAVPVEEWPVG